MPPAAADAARLVGRRKVALLLNHRAKGVSHALLAQLARIVGQEHVFASHTLAEAEAMAREVVYRRYDVVACGGGDGTLVGTFNRLRRYVNEANAWRQVSPLASQSRVAAWHLPSLAFLALGTGNAVRSVVGNRSPVADLTSLLYAQHLDIVPVPLIERLETCRPPAFEPRAPLPDDRFLFGGLGYDSLLLHDYRAFLAAHPHRAFQSLFGYVASAALRTLPAVIRQRALMTVRIESVGEAWYIDPMANDRPISLGRDVPLYAGEASLVGAATIAYFGYGMRAFPFAQQVPGTMHLRVLQLTAPQMLRALWPLWRGTLRDPARVFDFATTGVTIKLGAPFAFEHSGDDQGLVTEVALRMAAEPLSLVSFRAPTPAASAAPQAVG